jgi:ATP-dependent RNA helicase RhlE
LNSSFASLGLSENLVRAVTELGYAEPTAIQKQAIPSVLAGGDLMAGAQTGTGKTAAFVLPILQRLATSSSPSTRRAPRVLILAPTRELAAQVDISVREYARYLQVRSAAIFGGVSINPQISALKSGLDIVVATPGRLLDHVGQRTVDLSAVEVLVLDEADRMLDMGFLPDMKRVFSHLPKKRQTLLFSATFSDEIRALASSLLVNPVSVQVTPRNSTVDTVDQKWIRVEKTGKSALLAHLIREKQWFQVLVFTRTKHGANRLAEYLNKHGVTALPIHGNKSQNARTRALGDFKRGELQALVATDIAARGLDIEQLPHVVNFDLPHVAEDYVHRIGRTGRAGASGEAISLVSRDEETLLRDIERLIRRSIPTLAVPDFQPGTAVAHDPDHRPPRPVATRKRTEPSHQKRGASHRQHAQPNVRVGAPKQPSSGAQGSGKHASQQRTSTPHPARSAERRSPMRSDASAQGGSGSRSGAHRDTSSVRTNIPGLMSPPSRRGR